MSDIQKKERKVTVIYTQEGRKQEIKFPDAPGLTWEEVASQLELGTSGKKFTLRSTRNTLEQPKAIIPEGDQYIFATPRSSKFGAELTVGQVRKMAGNNLRRKVRQLIDKGWMPKSTAKSDTEGQRTALLNRLSEINAKQAKSEKKSKPEAKKAKAKAPKAEDLSIEDARKEAREMGLL